MGCSGLCTIKTKARARTTEARGAKTRARTTKARARTTEARGAKTRNL